MKLPNMIVQTLDNPRSRDQFEDVARKEVVNVYPNRSSFFSLHDFKQIKHKFALRVCNSFQYYSG